MISMLGFLAVYFSIRKPTEDERHGARPPAVKIATFAYGMHSLGSFRARGGVEYIVCVVRVRRGRGGGVGGLSECRSSRASAGLPPYVCKLQAPPV